MAEVIAKSPLADRVVNFLMVKMGVSWLDIRSDSTLLNLGLNKARITEMIIQLNDDFDTTFFYADSLHQSNCTYEEFLSLLYNQIPEKNRVVYDE